MERVSFKRLEEVKKRNFEYYKNEKPELLIADLKLLEDDAYEIGKAAEVDHSQAQKKENDDDKKKAIIKANKTHLSELEKNIYKQKEIIKAIEFHFLCNLERKNHVEEKVSLELKRKLKFGLEVITYLSNHIENLIQLYKESLSDESKLTELYNRIDEYYADKGILKTLQKYMSSEKNVENKIKKLIKDLEHVFEEDTRRINSSFNEKILCLAIELSGVYTYIDSSSPNYLKETAREIYKRDINLGKAIATENILGDVNQKLKLHLFECTKISRRRSEKQQSKNWEVIINLIKQGADINTIVNGRTPLEIASKTKNINVANKLIEMGAIKNKNILFFGPAGVGKGTQSAMLKKSLNVPHISTGEYFRHHLKRNTEIGLEAKEYIKEGKLVPDHITMKILEQAFNENDCRNGFIVDGLPRRVEQIGLLDEFLAKRGFKIDSVIAMDIKDREIRKRLTIRAKEQGRPDDGKPEVVQERIDSYKNESTPCLNVYQKRGIVKHINGKGKIDDIYLRIIQSLSPKINKTKEINFSFRKTA